MANPILGKLAEEVARTRSVIPSAIALIEGINARIQTAIDAALANGATEAELAPFTELEAGLEADNTALANAVAQNP